MDANIYNNTTIITCATVDEASLETVTLYETDLTTSVSVLRNGYDLPVYGLDNGLFYALHISAIACIFLSIICASSAIILAFRRHYGTRSFFSWTKCDRFVVYLAICDGLFNLAHGSDHADVLITKNHVYPETLCHFYGFVTNTFVSAQNLLVAIIAVNVFVLMFFQKKPNFGRCDWRLLSFIFGVPVCISSVLWYLGKFGPNGMFCLTDGVRSWSIYVFLISIPLLIILVLNSTLYLLSWWKIRSQLKEINTTLGKAKQGQDTTSINVAQNMSLFVAAFFIQWAAAGIYGVWSMIGNTPIVIFHITTTFTNLGGVLNLGVYFIVNRRRHDRKSVRSFRETVPGHSGRMSLSVTSETNLSESTAPKTGSLSTITH